MSVYGEEIIERLHQDSALRDNDNPMRKILDNGVGGWLDNFTEHPLQEEVFLQSAKSKYLDLHGKDYGIPRKIDESDEDYLSRIIYESLGHLTTEFLEKVYNLSVYSYAEDFDVTNNTLVSDNPYCSNEYMTVASDEIQNILNKKFIIDSGLTFLEGIL